MKSRELIFVEFVLMFVEFLLSFVDFLLFFVWKLTWGGPDRPGSPKYY